MAQLRDGRGDRRRAPSRGSLLRAASYVAAAAIGVLGALVAYAFLVPLPSLDSGTPPPGTVVLDARGRVLARDEAAGVRIPVPLEAIAPIMRDATIAAEDQRFPLHPGVDPLAVARAAAEYRSNPSGASTITQQLARGSYLDGAGLPLLLRKAREATIALQLEARLSKDEILEAYLNEVYFGRGAYGVEAAAQVYFGVSARYLTLAQASLLAGLPQTPAHLDPFEHPEAARERQRYVLDRLVATGAITASQATAAAATPLALEPPEVTSRAPHFTGLVYDELRRVRPDLLNEPGLVIETTLDSSLQAEALRSARARLAELEDRGAGNAAVVVLDPANGAILALLGGVDYDAPDGQVNMAETPRQPGSALKPFLYAAAFERGATAASPILDVPTTLDTASGPYSPVNYDQRFRGPVPLRVALASSLNVPAVRTLEEVGLDAFLEVAHRFGLRSLDAREAYGPAVALGGGEVTLLDLTVAYGALANGGELVEPFAITRIRDAEGGVVYSRPGSSPRRVLSEEHAFLLADILSDPVARMPGFGAATVLETPEHAAVKTGTSSGSRDNWTLGFTRDRVVGVWVGNADRAPMRNVSGIDGAAPIWRDVLTAATEALPFRPFEAPDGIVRATVCVPTGLTPAGACPSPVDEWFVAGTEPAVAESYYVAGTGGRTLLDPPLEARPWGVDARVRLASDSSPEDGGGLGWGPPPAADQPVYIASPAPGAVVYRSPELPRQELLLRAAVPRGAREVAFVVDGETVGSTGGFDPRVVWPLAAGMHTLEVVASLEDGTIVTASTKFEVR